MAFLAKETTPIDTSHSPPANSENSHSANIRNNLSTFHKNLSNGQYTSNAQLVALDCQWNYDGNMIISRAGFTAALGFNAEDSLRGVQAVDIYILVDGNVGVNLYRLSGKQSGPFAGLPLQSDGRFNVLGAERFIFDSEALLHDLVTVDPIGLVKAQMSHTAVAPAVPSPIVSKPNPQAPESYRDLLRHNMALLHSNVNAGNAAANAALAAGSVEVVENDAVACGRDAFVALASAQHMGKGAFPTKSFHDAHIVADGHLGAVEYVWQRMQEGAYMEIQAKGGMVRARGMLFLEFDEEGSVVKATGVWDEGVVANQLQGVGGYLYP